MTLRRRAARIQRRTMERLLSRHTRETAEVLPGSFVQPAGLAKGIVQLGKCTQEVEASRSDDFRKGQGVLVIQTGGSSRGGSSGVGKQRAMIPGPPVKAGPVAAVSVESEGTPYVAASWFVVRQKTSNNDIFVSRHLEDGSWLSDYGDPTVYATSALDTIGGPYGALAPYSDGWFTLIEVNRRTIHSIDLTLGGATYTAPSGTIATRPIPLGGKLRWIEMDQNDVGDPCVNPNPVKLRSSNVDLTGVATNATSSLSGVSGSGTPCNWGDTTIGIRNAYFGIGSRLAMMTDVTPTAPDPRYDYYFEWTDIGTASPALAEATVVRSGWNPAESDYDLDGTNTLGVQTGNSNVLIRDTSLINNAYSVWLAGTSWWIHVPPSQDAVYRASGVLTAPTLEKYNAVTSSPTLQSSITIAAHPTITSLVIGAWRVGG